MEWCSRILGYAVPGVSLGGESKVSCINGVGHRWLIECPEIRHCAWYVHSITSIRVNTIWVEAELVVDNVRSWRLDKDKLAKDW